MYCGYLSLDITIFEWECSHVLSTVENSAVMRTCPALGPRHQVGTPENLQKWQLFHEFSTERHKNVVYYGKIFCYMRICPWPLPPACHPLRFCTTRQHYNITLTIAITNTSHYNYNYNITSHQLGTPEVLHNPSTLRAHSTTWTLVITEQTSKMQA